MPANTIGMPIQYAFVNGAFVLLANYSMSFVQAELYSRRQRYALPVLQTRLLLAEQTAALMQRCAEVGFQMQIAISADRLRGIVSELISRNRYFHDAAVELSVHPDFGGAGNLQISAVLRPQTRFSPQKPGVSCSIVRNVYSSGYQLFPQANAETLPNVICILEPDGFIRHTSAGGIIVIKDNDCFVPIRPAQDALSPIYELLLHAASSTGLEVCNARIAEQDLLEADEVLFPCASTVLEWCSAYNRRRYFSRKFKRIARYIAEASGMR